MVKIHKVRAGQLYHWHPVMFDILHPSTTTASSLLEGSTVRVLKSKPGTPPANTMGHCYAETQDGQYLGLVHCNSLRPISK